MNSKSCRHILRLLESLSRKVDIINLHNESRVSCYQKLFTQFHTLCIVDDLYVFLWHVQLIGINYQRSRMFENFLYYRTIFKLLNY